MKAQDLLEAALAKHEIHLSLLIAETAIWANPEFHRQAMMKNGCPASHPKIRRARGKNEVKGGKANGIRFDDNTYANRTIKSALGDPKDFVGFEACHIWPKTCYDERYHTAIANLVLLPRALAGLSDHNAEVEKALQYRAYEIYGWWPEEKPQPKRPTFYPENWRAPEPLPTAMQCKNSAKSKPVKVKTIEASILSWQCKPETIVHKVIGKVASHISGISKDDLTAWIGDELKGKNPSGTINSMLTDKGNAYGKVLVTKDGVIAIHPEVRELVCSLHWGN